MNLFFIQPIFKKPYLKVLINHQIISFLKKYLRVGLVLTIFRAKHVLGPEMSQGHSFLALSFYNNEPSKNKHFLILPSSLARNSQEPKLKRIFEILWVLFEKSLSLYFDWPKSRIWRTLEKVTNIFCKWHFHNASKEVFLPKKFLNFMHRVKSAILAIFQTCPGVCQIQDLCRKSTKRDFRKKASRELDFLVLF